MRRPAAIIFLIVIGSFGCAGISTKAQPDRLTIFQIRPSETDRSIKRFNAPHYVSYAEQFSASDRLLVFLPGTGGRPGNVSNFLDFAALAGYRVVGLSYNVNPAVVEVCASKAEPSCSERFRIERIYGRDVSQDIDDAPNESVVYRLAALIKHLAYLYPDQRWKSFIDSHQQPRWDKITIAGHSQGAGMAAYIARKHRVQRALLFSGPWDFVQTPSQLAPWINGPGETPANRWFGVLHQKEATAGMILRAYQSLGIPDSQVLVFDKEPNQRLGSNPYHVSLVGNGATPLDSNGVPAYAQEWSRLLRFQ